MASFWFVEHFAMASEMKVGKVREILDELENKKAVDWVEI